MKVLFLEPKEFQEGDIIFLSGEYKAYKIKRMINRAFDLIEFSPNGRKEITVRKDWFAPIIFSVCRKED